MYSTFTGIVIIRGGFNRISFLYIIKSFLRNIGKSFFKNDDVLVYL